MSNWRRTLCLATLLAALVTPGSPARAENPALEEDLQQILVDFLADANPAHPEWAIRLPTMLMAFAALVAQAKAAL